MKKKRVFHDPRPDMDLRGFLAGRCTAVQPFISIPLLLRGGYASTILYPVVAARLLSHRCRVWGHEGSVVGFDRILEGLMIRKQREDEE